MRNSCFHCTAYGAAAGTGIEATTGWLSQQIGPFTFT